ncbi:MAG: HEPN domain-containing protein [Candidatus Paceibacterota bacterium]
MENNEFKKCLEKDKIVILEKAETLVPRELELAESDLSFSKDTFREEGYKWSTIQSYYSMFHTGRALLYAKNYREKSHFCLIEAIRFLYIEKGILSFEFLEALRLGKSLRENADYYGDFSKKDAERLIKAAEKFIKEARIILSNENQA